VVVVWQGRASSRSALALCVLLVAAICPPPTRPMSRRLAVRRWYRPVKPSPGVRVRVSPRSADMHYDDAVTFRCTARGGSTIIDMPFIKFTVRLPRCRLDHRVSTPSNNNSVFSYYVRWLRGTARIRLPHAG